MHGHSICSHRLLVAHRCALLALLVVGAIWRNDSPSTVVGDMKPNEVRYVATSDMQMPSHEGEKPFIDARTQLEQAPGASRTRIHRYDDLAFRIFYITDPETDKRSFVSVL